MIVIHASFEIGAGAPAGYDEWFTRLADLARAEPGCVRYQLLRDVDSPSRRTVVEVWDTEADLGAWGRHPVHAEMVTVGNERWDTRDFRVDLWMEAGGHVHVEQERFG